MEIFREIKNSIAMQGRAIGFIINNKMVWTLLIPIVLFFIMIFVGMVSIGELVGYFTEDHLPIYGGVLAVVFAEILFFIVFGLWGGYLIVVLMSPFMAYVSEKTENILTGKDYPFDLFKTLKDALRGILLALRNSLFEIFISIIVCLCGFFSLIGSVIVIPLGTVFLFFVSAYYYGFSFMDYTNERRELSIGQSVNYVKSRKGTAIGHGLIFCLLLFIPYAGPFLSAVFAIVSTVAATIDMVEKGKLS